MCNKLNVLANSRTVGRAKEWKLQKVFLKLPPIFGWFKRVKSSNLIFGDDLDRVSSSVTSDDQGHVLGVDPDQAQGRQNENAFHFFFFFFFFRSYPSNEDSTDKVKFDDVDNKMWRQFISWMNFSFPGRRLNSWILNIGPLLIWYDGLQSVMKQKQKKIFF